MTSEQDVLRCERKGSAAYVVEGFRLVGPPAGNRHIQIRMTPLVTLRCSAMAGGPMFGRRPPREKARFAIGPSLCEPMKSKDPSTVQTAPTPNPIQWPGHICTDRAATSGQTPHATLTASAEALDLKSTLGDFHLPRTAVTQVHRGQLYPWFFAGIRIRHTLKGASKRLQFVPDAARSRDVLAALKTLGYPVS